MGQSSMPLDSALITAGKLWPEATIKNLRPILDHSSGE
jgi:hypothetical protein